MKSENRSSRRAQPRAAGRPIPLAIALLFGTGFTAVGLAIFGLQLGFVPSDPDAVRAQPVMLWLAGVIFTGAGLGLLCARLIPKLAAFCGLMAFCAFVGLFNWIAFGPGERDFRRGGAVAGGNVVSGQQVKVSESEGRWVFGLFAGTLDALFLFGCYRVLRTGRGSPPRRAP